MTDIFTVEKRSDVMRRIRSKDTGPERVVRGILEGLGAEFTENDRTLPGSPDFAIHLDVRRGPAGIAVFVHGCFWHSCPRHSKRPKSNRRFWREKFGNNRRRDARVRRALNRAGWSVRVVWEHDTRKKRLPALRRCLEGILCGF